MQAWKKCVSALAECHFANRHFCHVAGTFGLTGGLKRKKRKKKRKKKKNGKKENDESLKSACQKITFGVTTVVCS